KPPYTLAPAQYRDTMTFEACLDSACNDVIPGTMVAIPVTYTVSAPTGPNAPQLILGSSSLQATASPGDQSPPAMRSIAVSVSNMNSLAQFTISVSQKQPSIFQAQTQYQSRDRKSTRLNSSHRTTSYAAICLKKTRTGP